MKYGLVAQFLHVSPVSLASLIFSPFFNCLVLLVAGQINSRQEIESLGLAELASNSASLAVFSARQFETMAARGSKGQLAVFPFCHLTTWKPDGWLGIACSENAFLPKISFLGRILTATKISCGLPANILKAHRLHRLCNYPAAGTQVRTTSACLSPFCRNFSTLSAPKK